MTALKEPAMAEAVGPIVRGRDDSTTGRRFVGVVAGLTSINVLVRGLALITGPLSARALGPEGRGELAAIVAPLTILWIVAMLGLQPYAVREVARGRPPGTILASIGVPLLLTGAVCMLLAVPIASFFADGRDTVQTFLLIGILTLPLSLIGQLLVSVTNGLQLWKTVAIVRLIPALGGLVGIVVLYLMDSLTVATAATITLVTSLAASGPALYAVAKRHYPLRVDREVLHDGSRFGLKAWANQLTTNANARLDQLLMTRVVTSAELGLYAVAVNTAAVAELFTTALVVPLAVRVARGEAMVVARALRMTIMGAALVALVLAVAIPGRAAAAIRPRVRGCHADGADTSCRKHSVGRHRGPRAGAHSREPAGRWRNGAIDRPRRHRAGPSHCPADLRRRRRGRR